MVYSKVLTHIHLIICNFILEILNFLYEFMVNGEQRGGNIEDHRSNYPYLYKIKHKNADK